MISFLLNMVVTRVFNFNKATFDTEKAFDQFSIKNMLQQLRLFYRPSRSLWGVEIIFNGRDFRVCVGGYTIVVAITESKSPSEILSLCPAVIAVTTN
jgi:hypothetical protein